MSTQSTLQRTLEMMAMLSDGEGHTIKDLAEYFEVSQGHTANLFTIRWAGYGVERENGRYKLTRDPRVEREGLNIGDLLYFSKEEAHILSEAINSIEATTSVKEALKSKLYTLYKSDRVAYSITRDEDKESVKILLDAIKNKKQVIISELTFISANRGVNDVIIEPLGFAFNFRRIWAYYPAHQRNVVISLSAILGVKATNKPFRHTDQHQIGYTDPFRGYGFEKVMIRLTLNRRSYGLMIDEFPLTKDHIKPTDDPPNRVFELKTEVCRFNEVGRFIAGLPYDIQINEPQELILYVKDLLKSGLNS